MIRSYRFSSPVLAWDYMAACVAAGVGATLVPCPWGACDVRVSGVLPTWATMPVGGVLAGVSTSGQYSVAPFGRVNA